jgi:hypothetical protein
VEGLEPRLEGSDVVVPDDMSCAGGIRFIDAGVVAYGGDGEALSEAWTAKVQ